MKIINLKSQIQMDAYEYAKNRTNGKLSGGVFIFNARRILDANSNESLDGKRADYMNLYNDFFVKENEFTVSGSIVGHRKYDYILCGCKDDLALTYRYDTFFDKDLFKSIVDANDMKFIIYSRDDFENDIDNAEHLIRTLVKEDCVMLTDRDGAEDVIIRKSHFAQAVIKISSIANKMDLKLDNLLGSSVNEETVQVLLENEFSMFDVGLPENDYSMVTFKLYEDTYLISRAENTKLISDFIASLHAIKSYQFVDYVKGQHFYKESNYQKSNVFSLKIRNSGLAYDELLSWEDVVYASLRDGEDTAPSAISGRYMQIDENITELKERTSLEDSTFYSDYNNYKYLKKPADSVANDVKDELEQKIYLRNLLEEAIRKSIHRYIPANTTLWKIEYEN